MPAISDILNCDKLLDLKKEKKEERKTLPKHFFIDETGDPDFYGHRKKLLIGQPGYSSFLIIGMIEVIERKNFRNQILEFQKTLLADDALRAIHSLHKPDWFLHAAKDHPGVRERFFKFLLSLDFTAYMIIGRKSLKIFERRHKSNTGEFYFDLVQHLIEKRFNYDNNQLILSNRTRTTLTVFSGAVNKALEKYKRKKVTKTSIERIYKCSIESSKNCPELSVTDYMLWALQRYISQNDSVYFKMMEKKYAYICDLYENKHYHINNKFSLDKAKAFL